MIRGIHQKNRGEEKEQGIRSNQTQEEQSRNKERHRGTCLGHELLEARLQAGSRPRQHPLLHRQHSSRPPQPWQRPLHCAALLLPAVPVLGSLAARGVPVCCFTGGRGLALFLAESQICGNAAPPPFVLQLEDNNPLQQDECCFSPHLHGHEI